MFVNSFLSIFDNFFIFTVKQAKKSIQLRSFASECPVKNRIPLVLQIYKQNHTEHDQDSQTGHHDREREIDDNRRCRLLFSLCECL